MPTLNYMDVFRQAQEKLARQFSPRIAQTALDCLKCVQETGGDGWREGVAWLRGLVKANAALPGMYALLGSCYRMTARECLDDYLIYLEWRREPEKKFYLPRRRVLRPVVEDLQDLYDGRIDFLGLSLRRAWARALSASCL